MPAPDTAAAIAGVMRQMQASGASPQQIQQVLQRLRQPMLQGQGGAGGGPARPPVGGSPVQPSASPLQRPLQQPMQGMEQRDRSIPQQPPGMPPGPMAPFPNPPGGQRPNNLLSQGWNPQPIGPAGPSGIPQSVPPGAQQSGFNQNPQMGHQQIGRSPEQFAPGAQPQPTPAQAPGGVPQGLKDLIGGVEQGTFGIQDTTRQDQRDALLAQPTGGAHARPGINPIQRPGMSDPMARSANAGPPPMGDPPPAPRGAPGGGDKGGINPDFWRTLMDFGLATMAAGDRPGASTLGALGRGGMAAMRGKDLRDIRNSKYGQVTQVVTDAQGKVWGITKTGKKVDLNIKGRAPGKATAIEVGELARKKATQKQSDGFGGETTVWRQDIFDQTVKAHGFPHLAGGPGGSPQAPGNYQEGATARHPNGKKIEMRGGQWVDPKTGKPVGK